MIDLVSIRVPWRDCRDSILSLADLEESRGHLGAANTIRSLVCDIDDFRSALGDVSATGNATTRAIVASVFERQP